MDKKEYERRYYQQKTKDKKKQERMMIEEYPALKEENKKLLIRNLYLETIIESLELKIDAQKLLIDSYSTQLNYVIENNPDHYTLGNFEQCYDTDNLYDT